MIPPLPLTRDLVLIGGGHAHALVLRMWGMDPLPGVRLTLINPGPTAPYSGMLPGHIAGHYDREALDIDLVRLARFAGARLIRAAATGIDPTARSVQVAGRGEIGYDVASVDIGIHAQMPELPGFAEHGIGAKPLDIYADRWRAFLAQVAAGGRPPEVAVIGGGVAGVELALAMAHALRRATGAAGRVTILETGPGITGRNPPARRILARALSAAGVQVLTGVCVARIDPEAVHLDDGRAVASQFTVATAGARAHGWLAACDLPLTEDGFVRVRPDLRVQGHDSLFAVGDCAHLAPADRPKAGVFAVRAAPVLRDNLRAVLSGGQTRAFAPQGDYLKLVSLGGKRAMAEKWGLSLSAPLLWRWKDRIDQTFMDQFRTLPQMPAPALPAQVALGLREEIGDAAMLCGGCGAKVGPGPLKQALTELPAPQRDDLRSGPGDDAAILSVGGATQVLTTDHLRAFTGDWGLMARIAALHALGDIWAMGAAPQAALVSLTLPRMSAQMQTRTMTEIMGAADRVLRKSGAVIAGGHSSMGAELSLGFTLTGLVDGTAITSAGAQDGDDLILTRPIGSGTILSAEMKGVADGRDVAALLDVLATPQADAAALLRDAHAMTDVTGFGLAGHLMAICRASGLGADVEVEEIPLFDGAEALAAAGHRSTIWQANAADYPVAGATGARAVLLHDPQTAGGFLAALPPDRTAERLEALRAAGHRAARIGRLHAGPVGITAQI